MENMENKEINAENTKDAERQKPSKSDAKGLKGKKKKKTMAFVKSGVAHIQSTYNNTFVTLSDQSGNVLSWSTAGHIGFKGAKKSTPYAASMVVKDAVDKVRDAGMKEVTVLVKGVGGGREGAIRALSANGLNILSIRDITPIPHNGCRPKKPRRV